MLEMSHRLHTSLGYVLILQKPPFFVKLWSHDPIRFGFPSRQR
jgi:hypothetical protein